MALKILDCTIKTIDDKNHVRIWNKNEVEIKFKEEKPKEEVHPTLKDKLIKRKPKKS